MSFRREKYVAFGGPNGGDGGRGGHIIVEAIGGLNTLVDFRYQRHFKAQKGQHGMGKDCTGKTGEDIIMGVPIGTQIWDEDEEFMICDLKKIGDKITLCEGGTGGLGNTHFKSATTRAPRRSTPGGDGEEMYITLRLKLLADSGLVGLPNAGKSTFLSCVSRAKPKIADYPFTTMSPQLGVVGYKDHEFVLADIPGLIEGASEGIGLGHRFLGHVERCGVLLHLIDGTEEDVAGAYKTIMGELEAYTEELLKKPMIIGLNKIDALSDEEISEKRAALEAVSDRPIMLMSGVTHEGVEDILGALWDVVKDDIARRMAEEDEGITVKEDTVETTPTAPKSEWSPI